jgi:hypothetical protein
MREYFVCIGKIFFGGSSMVLSDLFLLLFNDTMFAHICGVLPFAATWMELEDVILSEMSQAQKRQVPHDLVHI